MLPVCPHTSPGILRSVLRGSFMKSINVLWSKVQEAKQPVFLFLQVASGPIVRESEKSARNEASAERY